ncbi:MAG: hypothetical protein U9N46_10875 [Euryarchaeota archaeon]|nr:hypothetical protein [Euryarchaeota archaeon]
MESRLCRCWAWTLSLPAAASDVTNTGRIMPEYPVGAVCSVILT